MRNDYIREIVIVGNKSDYNQIVDRIRNPENVVGWVNFINNAEDGIELSFSEEKLGTLLTDRNCLFIAANIQQLVEARERGALRALNYEDFSDTWLEDPLATFYPEENYQGLLFGMSHSQCAIDVRLLAKPTYKIASPSMDMFLHLMYLKRLLKQYPKALEKIDTIILEIPYYIFNYDLSCFGKFVLSKLYYYYLVDNFHHFGERESQNEKLVEFLDFIQVVQMSNEEKKSQGIKRFIPRLIKLLFRYANILSSSEKVWTDLHRDTIAENEEYFNEFVSTASEFLPNAKIVILVMPFNPVFRWKNKYEIQLQKDIFYGVIEEHKKICVLDYFDMDNCIFHFSDHCHLQQLAGIEFTKRIKDVF